MGETTQAWPTPSGGAPTLAQVTPHDYERLAELRAGLRGYLAWAEDEARRHDTTPMQFQLALAIRAFPAPSAPTVSELAESLHLKHHSVVGLIDRSEAAGIVHRERDTANAARVRISLTPAGAELLEQVARQHQQHLALIATSMSQAWLAFSAPDSTPPA